MDSSSSSNSSSDDAGEAPQRQENILSLSEDGDDVDIRGDKGSGDSEIDDALVLHQMKRCDYLSENPMRAPRMVDISKAEISSDDEETFDHVMALPNYMKAVCVKARSRNLAVKRLLKDLIDAEGAYISAISRINLKHFPLQTCMIDLEAKTFITNYKREVSNRVRFHSVIQGRMKRQYNRVHDLLLGREGSRGRNSMPPILQCSLCVMSGDVRNLKNDEVSFCLNRSCVFHTCMKCAFKLTDEEKKCPGCRSHLAVYPGSNPSFVISRGDYLSLHGSLFPEYPLTLSQFFSSNTIVTASNLAPVEDLTSSSSSSSSSSSDHHDEI